MTSEHQIGRQAIPAADELSDEELALEIQRSPSKGRRLFEVLVHRNQSRVLANCTYLTNSPADAEDLAQEVFVKAFFGIARFEGRSSLRTWIQRIKVNHCLNFLTRRRGPELVSIDEPGAPATAELSRPPDVERALESVSMRRHIRTVLGSLPDSLRVPLLLRDLDGLAYAEIGEVLSLGESAVKMRIKRGREEFRKRYRLLLDPRRQGARVQA